jgi:putative ABC transport system ATP-binding protein
MYVLEAENLVKVYKGRDKSNSTRALNGIGLKIENGEFAAIMGPSGSGKTTLLNVLSGIDRAYEGKIQISGVSIHNMSGDELALFRRRRLGFVFQEFNLLDSLSLRENVMLPMVLDKKSVAEMSQKTDKVMAMLDIHEIMDKYPYTVSGGQQQRTAICRAVINEPDIVFADEPTGNLDSKSSKAVMKCLERLNTLNHSTIIIVTHDAFAASYCNKVIFIKDGLVHMEISKKGERKDFFDDILERLAIVGGEKDDL